MRRTKIVITVGPSTDDLQTLKKLIKNGVNVFRLNFSHATHQYHKNTIDKIRQASLELNIEVAILQDISGPKIRICELKNSMDLKCGDILTLSKDKIDEKSKTVTLSYPEIIDSLKLNQKVYFSDGTIVAIVKKKTENFVQCEIIVAETLHSKKGVNFPDSKLNIDTITSKDKKDLVFGANNGVDIVALSFVSNKNDIVIAREILNKNNANPLIFSKIEKPEAIENLDSILKESDGVMVARGDLGVELGVHKVPSIQKMIISKANELTKPTIVATQMLTSMINSPYPTRAEISDIANAVLDGSDAVMLSDETTIGKYPLETIKVLNKSIKEAEKIYPFYRSSNSIKKNESIAAAATILVKSISPNAIITFTRTGKSALQLSKFRPKEKIIVSSYDISTLRKLQVVWGINGFYLSDEHNHEKELIANFLNDAIQQKDILLTNQYVLTIGYPLDSNYATNQIKILDKNTMEYIINYARNL